MRWILIMLLLPDALTAQEYRITGKVVDNSTGHPLIGANVIATYDHGTDSTQMHGAATGVNGGFVVLLASKGKPSEILLKVYSLGYERYQTRLPAYFPDERMKLGRISLQRDYTFPHPRRWHRLWNVWNPFGRENEKATNFRTVIYHDQLMATPLF